MPPVLAVILGAALMGACLAVLLSGCSSSEHPLKDGFFTAQADDFGPDGWKDFLTIYVSNGQIAIVEFDAVNLSGFRRSWDMDYRLRTIQKYGARAVESASTYQSALLTLQDAARVQPVAGARRMHRIFTTLAEAAVGQSKRNDKSIAYVTLPADAFPGSL
jgi:major membrane immunogen (membrane-anchored lipoprotein)